MKWTLTVVLTFWVILTTTASLAAGCDEVTAANLNGEVEEEFLRLDVSGNINSSKQSKIKGLKQRFAEASDIHTQAVDGKNEVELNKACNSYRSILDEAIEISE